MKNLLILITIMLVGVGCGKDKEAQTKTKVTEDNNATKSVKELTAEEQKALRDSVVGEYEYKDEDGDTFKYVYLENGIVEIYRSGKKRDESKWSIVDGELHIEVFGDVDVWRINNDKSITGIACIVDGKREYLPKDLQVTWKKIK